jgi:hypothetical protein
LTTTTLDFGVSNSPHSPPLSCRPTLPFTATILASAFDLENPILCYSPFLTAPRSGSFAGLQRPEIHILYCPEPYLAHGLVMKLRHGLALPLRDTLKNMSGAANRGLIFHPVTDDAHTRPMKNLLALTLLALLAGCASYQSRIDKLQSESQARGYCKVHKEKLQEIIVYRQNAKICIFPDPDDYRAWLRSPNTIPFECTTERSASAHLPDKVWYCQTCERTYNERSRE